MKRSWTAVLLTVLMLSLCACCAKEEGDTSVPAAQEKSASEQEEDMDPWTEADVQTLLEEHNARLVGFQDIGGIRLVRYEQEYDLLQALAVVDDEARTLTPLVGGLMPEAKVAAPEDDALLNGLYILHPGTNPHGPQRCWPTVERLWLPRSEVMPLDSSVQPYPMPRESSFTIGHHTGARVERVTLGSKRIYFEFLDDGGLFVGGGPLTPVMEVSFEGDVCTVFFPETSLDEGFSVVNCEESSEHTPVCRSAENTEEGALLRFDCGLLYQRDDEERQTRWYIEESEHPITWLPRATICFESHWPENWPEGW